MLTLLSEESNLLEWALGNAFNVVRKAKKKKEEEDTYTFWIITCWCFDNIHLKRVFVIHYVQCT